MHTPQFSKSILATMVALALSPSVATVANAQDSDASADNKRGVLEETVVVARRRAESLQDIPAAVTAITSNDFQRYQATNLADLSYTIPNLGITANQTTANSAQIYIRGIGQDDSTPNFEPGVALYVDGVYMAKLQGSLLDLPSFERIEVLRGPQGTLYGRNSSGGAISFITRKPNLEEYEYSGELTVGEFDRRDVSGRVSVPIVEGTLGATLDFVSMDRDGYITRLSDGEDVNRIDRQGARLAVRWLPSDTVTVDVAVDVSRDRSGIQVPTPLAPGNSLPGGVTPAFGYYVSDPDIPDLNELDTSGLSAIVEWELGSVNLKSITAWRGINNEFFGDLEGRTGTGLDIYRNLDQSQFTQEIQLTSTGDGRLQWVAGVFYLLEDYENFDTLFFSSNPGFLHNTDQETTSYAVYADVSYDITDALSLNLGGRFTSDEKDYTVDADTFAPPFTTSATESFEEFTPKVGLSYQFSDGEGPLVYGTWQEGIKAGAFPGFPSAADDVATSFLPPEEVDTFEIGLKADWLDGRLRTNVAYFDSEYSNLQLTVREGDLLVPAAVTSEISGWEFEMTALPTDTLTINASLGTLEGEYTDSNTGAVAENGGHLKFAPELQWNIGIDWTLPMSGGDVILSGNYQWIDDVYLNAAINEIAFQEQMDLLDVSIRYEDRDGWYVRAGVQNATDTEWASTGSSSNGGRLFAQLPRTWALSFGYRN